VITETLTCARKRRWQVANVGLVLLAVHLFGLTGCEKDAPPDNDPRTTVRIAVFQIVDYELIANMRRAFADEIESSEFAKTRDVVLLPYKDAHNDVNLTNQISDQLIADDPDLIYVLGTPAAQALVERTSKIPIVQGAVTDPVAAKMAASWKGSARNYAASTDFPPVKAQFELLKKILPRASTVGAIYSSGEANSRALMERVRPVCKELGYELVERPVTGTAEVPTSATALMGKADVVYVTTDNTVLAALPSLLEIAKDNRVPVVTCTKEDVKQGALFALGASYEELSRIAARIALRILEGEDPGRIPIAFAEKPELYWNIGTAEQLGIELKAELADQVNTWYLKGEEVSRP
jgi:putative ABC transport system substrate-binding protein